ncbi:Uncharacterised protein [Mycobacteroides abscessus subsp. abscessus]|nr:Uncharacterised protein [Mycobacteroides abscessus subsp. abscessus]
MRPTTEIVAAPLRPQRAEIMASRVWRKASADARAVFQCQGRELASDGAGEGRLLMQLRRPYAGLLPGAPAALVCLTDVDAIAIEVTEAEH